MVLTSMFILLCTKIEEAVRLQNNQILDRYTNGAFSMGKQEKALLKSRSDALRNLKVIVWTLWSTTFFNLVYSICVKIMYNSDCAP
jgi:hypothetical protein